ncbi:LysR family transcriptional regulator [Amycolatopsis acidicola]|uniref:LysR family transcriptional regulator n=1 Tax=Amycolatopsis acidicola TaxID=2596893 RepID=A0A5N0UZ32_9PSEU|nr:LysR family transcriptional regulator [Amycolatopsis acidicola]KAA9156779.1 LysR family transcriptional regulator [Amycolatopsis acidicola]
MEIRHLRYFVAVAEEGGFGRAAERVAMATSPLSRRVRDLEEELGTPLFVRDYHQVSLTEAGQALLPEARAILERFDALPSLVPHSSGGTVLVVGTAPEVSPGLRTRFLDLVRERRPGVVVRQRPASTGPLVRGVVTGEVDLAFVHGSVDDPRLESVVVESQPVRVVVAKGIGFDGRESVGLAELAHLPYTYLKAAAAPFVVQATETLLRRYGVMGRAPVNGGHADLVPRVSAGEAFTICGAEFGATRKVLLDEPVVFLKFEHDRIRLHTNAVWCRGRDRALHGLPRLARSLAGT